MLARAWNATPIATAGTADKCEACLSFGAAHAINYKDADFVAAVDQLTEGRGVDVILDLVGGPYLPRNLAALAPEGRITVVSTQGGRTGDLDLGKMMQKRARIMGSTMRARTPEQKGEVAQRLLKDVWPLLPGKNPIRPVVDATFRLEDARLAHARMEHGEHIGKIVLTT
jgi:NADPH:quinone reductase-like Zn-dependent oxidoreductase